MSNYLISYFIFQWQSPGHIKMRLLYYGGCAEHKCVPCSPWWRGLSGPRYKMHLGEWCLLLHLFLHVYMIASSLVANIEHVLSSGWLKANWERRHRKTGFSVARNMPLLYFHACLHSHFVIFTCSCYLFRQCEHNVILSLRNVPATCPPVCWHLKGKRRHFLYF